MNLVSTLTLTINATAKTGRLTDTTDYAAVGVDVTTMEAKGLGTIYFNGDILFQRLTIGSPLINLAGGATYVDFDLDLDTTGELANGTYEVDYSVGITLDVNSVAGDITAPYDSVVLMEGTDFAQNLEEGDTFTITGGSNAGEWTVESAENVSGQLGVHVDAAMVTEGDVGATAYFLFGDTFSSSYTYSGCTQKTASVSISADCNYGTFGSFTAADSTDYGTQTMVSSEMTINYPAWTQNTDDPPAPVVVTSDERISKTITRLATGTWTVSLSDVMSYTQTDGLIVSYTITVEEEFRVSCAGSFCCMASCYITLANAHYEALRTNRVSQYQQYFDQCTRYFTLASIYQQCGEYAQMQSAIASFQSTLDSSNTCTCSDCDDDDLRWVVNGSTEVITAITELQAQVAELDLNRVIFFSPWFYGKVSGTGYPVSPTVIRPFTDVSEITIPKEHFEAEPNGFSNKSVEIEIESWGRIDGVLRIRNGSTVLYEDDAPSAGAVSTRHKIILTTRTYSAQSFQCVLSNRWQLDNNDPVNTLDKYYLENIGTDLWDTSEDLVLDFTPSATDEQYVAYTYIKITGIAY